MNGSVTSNSYWYSWGYHFRAGSSESRSTARYITSSRMRLCCLNLGLRLLLFIRVNADIIVSTLFEVSCKLPGAALGTGSADQEGAGTQSLDAACLVGQPCMCALQLLPVGHHCSGGSIFCRNILTKIAARQHKWPSCPFFMFILPLQVERLFATLVDSVWKSLTILLSQLPWRRLTP